MFLGMIYLLVLVEISSEDRPLPAAGMRRTARSVGRRRGSVGRCRPRSVAKGLARSGRRGRVGLVASPSPPAVRPTVFRAHRAAGGTGSAWPGSVPRLATSAVRDDPFLRDHVEARARPAEMLGRPVISDELWHGQSPLHASCATLSRPGPAAPCATGTTGRPRFRTWSKSYGKRAPGRRGGACPPASAEDLALLQPAENRLPAPVARSRGSSAGPTARRTCGAGR